MNTPQHKNDSSPEELVIDYKSLSVMMNRIYDKLTVVEVRLDKLDNIILEDETTRAEIRHIFTKVDGISDALKMVSVPNNDLVVTVDEVVKVTGIHRKTINQCLRRYGIKPANDEGRKKFFLKNEVFSMYASSITDKNMDLWLTMGIRLD